MEATTSTTADARPQRPRAPILEVIMPACSLCGQTVQYEDRTFYCLTCRVQWPRRSAFWEDGRWSRPDAARCDAADQPFSDVFDQPGVRTLLPFRCYLDQGHEPGPDGRTTHYNPHHPDHEWSTGPDGQPEPRE